MDNEKIEKTIRTYLPQIAHMSLATSKDNKPRVFEVHFVWDNDLNIYFCSSKESQHSQDVRDNPNVAGTIVTQHFLEQKVRGVYFEGICEQLENLADDDPIVLAYEQRFGMGPQIAQAAREDGKARFYKITVQDYYLIDGYDTSPAQKYHLSREV